MAYQLIETLQKKAFHAGNTFEFTKTSVTLSNGRTCHQDICYSNKYPNSVLDIYLPEECGNPLPVFFYIHGGGFCWGDKTEYNVQDPSKGNGELFANLNNAGIAVVTAQYALAPQYTYPTPVHQMLFALQFLKENAEAYTLDMSRVAFGGDSAGAQLAGQMVNLHTNPSYAEDLGMTPVLSKDSIKAFVSFSGLINTEQFETTHMAVTDWLFGKCGKAYFHCEKLAGNPIVAESSVIQHLSESFPPSFISDANTASFYDQAQEMKGILTKFQIPFEFCLFPRKEAVLIHGYETADTPQAKEVRSKATAFLCGKLSV